MLMVRAYAEWMRPLPRAARRRRAASEVILTALSSAMAPWIRSGRRLGRVLVAHVGQQDPVVDTLLLRACAGGRGDGPAAAGREPFPHALLGAGVLSLAHLGPLGARLLATGLAL